MEIEAIPGRDDAWRVGDTEFEHNFGLDSTPERFHIREPASLMARYSDLCPSMVRPSSPGIVRSITVDQHWLSVRRGPDDVDTNGFRVAGLYSDYLHWLQA